MISRSRETRLGLTLDALSSLGVVPQVLPLLEATADTVYEELRTSVPEEIPGFSASGNPDVLPEQARHATDNMNEIRRLLGGGRVSNFEFVGEYARRRASQRFPLEACLHADRCSHKILSRWIQDAALAAAPADAQVRRVVAAVADFAFEYTDSISTVATAEYIAQTRRLAEAEGDRRSELLNVLLSGFDEADGRVARLLRQSGYLRQRQAYCVVVAQPVEPSEMRNPARAQRLADSLVESVRENAVRSIVGIRDNVVVAIFSATRRQSGWTAPQSALAARLQPELLKVGIAALIGVSADVPSTSHIPTALGEARVALEFASVADRVMPFSRVPFRKMLVRIAGEQLQSALPPWLDKLIEADRKSRGALVRTLEAYADADMNVLKTAKALTIHPNTIYARMQKINDITGRNALNYHALTEMLLAAECARQG